MPMNADPDATELLLAVRNGDEDARARLFSLLYEELRTCAHRQLRDRYSHTLSTTALVNETYLKLSAASLLGPESRRHFLAIAAQAMRQVLVDHARRVFAEKRGGDAIKVTLDERIRDNSDEAMDVLALDQALSLLESVDERAARVVQLHFFGGLNFSEIATLEGLTERTIKRDWSAARLMLASEMRSGTT